MKFQSMIMNNNKTFVALCTAVAATLSISRAELFTYTDGNLILGFQATAGTGSTKNVFFNLGSATGFRDNGNQGVLGNIGATLATVYGSDWYTRTDLYFGVIANLNQQPNSGFGSRNPVNGDPSRTFYISAAAASPGAGPLVPAATFPASALGTGGTSLSGLENVLKPSSDGTGWITGSTDPLAQGLQKEPDGAGILDQTLAQHAVAWNNSWTRWNPSPGAAFDIFTGGIQQNFGKGDAATYVDVQRILAYSAGASPAGVVGGGTYETTISIGSSGSITAQSATTNTPFQTWALTFPALDTSAKRLPDADPDNDGVINLMEFVLNGNPGTSDNASIAPTLNASGSNFIFAFNRRADSAGDVTQVFEYSTDLADWTTKAPVTIPTTPGTTGFVAVGASSGTAPNQVQAVTVTIPKGSDTKLFGRLKITQ